MHTALRLRMAATVICALALHGCAGTGIKTAYESDMASSEALNVLMAAGLVSKPGRGPIRDLPREDRPQGVSEGNAALDVGFAAVNAFSPPLGVAGGLAAGVSGATLLLPSGGTPLDDVVVLAWMPAHQATDAEAARIRMDELLDGAMKRAMDVFPAPYRPVANPPAGMYRMPISGMIDVYGGPCSREGIRCRYWAGVYKKPISAPAPDFLGGGPSWTWRGSEYGASTFHYSAVDESGFLHKYHPWLPDLEFYRAMSAELPEWVYLYLGPGTVSLGPKRGFLQVPAVLNRGRTLAFVEPVEPGREP